MAGWLCIEVQPSTMQIDKMEETSHWPGPPDRLALADQADRIMRRAGDEAIAGLAGDRARPGRAGRLPDPHHRALSSIAAGWCAAAQTQNGSNPVAPQEGSGAQAADPQVIGEVRWRPARADTYAVGTTMKIGIVGAGQVGASAAYAMMLNGSATRSWWST